jgi:hypothetical protein
MRLYRRNEIGKVAAGTALAGADKAAKIAFEGADEKTVFLITTTGADSVVVCHGAGSVNANDITLRITEAGTFALTLDSAFFMGTDGNVEFKGATSTKVAVVVLP